MNENSTIDVTELLNENGLSLNSIEVVEDICIHIVDKNGKTIYYSKGCEMIEGQKKEYVIDKTLNEVYDFDDVSANYEDGSMQLKVLKTGKPIINKNVIYKSSLGKTINVISSTYPVIKNNEVIAAICVFRDFTDILTMSETIKQLQIDLNHEKVNVLKNGTQFCFNDIIGSSQKIKETVILAKKAATNNLPVLIQGSTGTGKEMFAQSIHNYSKVAKGPFIAINCSAIPDTLLESTLFGTSKGAYTGSEETIGLFQAAENGTIFLDEINSMSLNLQAKLLRVLETKKIRKVGNNKEIPINARIISATNTDPFEAIKNKLLRSDIFYRLAAVNIELPYLKERTEDIPSLVEHFIFNKNKIMGKQIQGITDKALNILNNYSWPGNIRELQHAIDYALNIVEINDSLIESGHLPKYILENTNIYKLPKSITYYKSNSLNNTLHKIEKDIISKELSEHNNNISLTAKKLGVSRQNLQYKMKVLNIKCK